VANEMTLKELILKAMEDNKCGANILNKTILEISKSTGKKPGFIKFAVTDETAEKFMCATSLVGVLLTIDRDYVEKIIAQVDEESA
jgi:hypothetical protein